MLRLILKDKRYGETKYIKKIGDKWRIISSKDGKMWDAKYDTAEKAHKAMMAYHIQQAMADKTMGTTKYIKQKPNGKWQITYSKTGKPWNAEYDTAELAHAALSAYWAQKDAEDKKNKTK